jgi:hypothetical protein
MTFTNKNKAKRVGKGKQNKVTPLYSVVKSSEKKVDSV